MTPSLRIATEADTRLIHSNFFMSYWKLHAHKHILKEVYDSEMDKRIDQILSRSRVLVAFFPEVPDEVLGWSCVEGSTMHYAYVKAVYRRRGIATGLVPDKTKFYTHRTDREGLTFAEKMSLKFNPFLLEK